MVKETAQATKVHIAKVQLALPGKTIHRKQLLPSGHFLLSQARSSHKNLERNQLRRHMLTN